MDPLFSGARQIMDTDVILIDLDGITYLTSIQAAEYALQEDKSVRLLTKYPGGFITGGRLFPARTGKTVYAHVRHTRYRIATWQFEKVIDGPGYLAPALVCSPREVTA